MLLLWFVVRCVHCDSTPVFWRFAPCPFSMSIRTICNSLQQSQQQWPSISDGFAQFQIRYVKVEQVACSFAAVGQTEVGRMRATCERAVVRSEGSGIVRWFRQVMGRQKHHHQNRTNTTNSWIWAQRLRHEGRCLRTGVFYGDGRNFEIGLRGSGVNGKTKLKLPFRTLTGVVGIQSRGAKETSVI